MRLTTRILAACATVATIGATAALIDGCMSPTCMETATCPDSEDVIQPTDQTVDAVSDVRLEADSTIVAQDAQEAGIDSMTDSPIDSTVDRNESPDVIEEDVAVSDAAGEGGPDAESGTPCTGTCAAPAPSGWFGPGAFYDGPYDGAAPPPCEAPYTYNPFTQFSSLEWQAATCACSCGALDAGCSSPTITIYDDNVCVNACAASAVPGSCTTVCAQGGRSAIVTTPPAALAPSCGAPGSTMSSDPTPTWSRQGEACGLPGSTVFTDAGCASDSICAAAPPPGFFLCIWKQGNVQCPTTGSYTLLLSQYYGVTDYIDTRSCSATNCTCTPANAGCQLVGVSGFGSTGCPGTPNMLANLDAGVCNENLPTTVSMMTTVMTSSSGSCSSGGTASPAGSVSAATPTWTVCCTQ